jgi:hypothetical protein
MIPLRGNDASPDRYCTSSASVHRIGASVYVSKPSVSMPLLGNQCTTSITLSKSF